MRYIFAGDRDIAVWVLKDLIHAGYSPLLLMVSSENKATHRDELISLSGLSNDHIISGKEFSSNENLERIRSIQPDYIIGIHFPYIIRKELLDIPKYGFLNLHPAYLPYNRGWHTPTWAIQEGTPAGATLHFMSEELDMGDIIARKQVEIAPCDTANSLYQKMKMAERELFKSVIDDIAGFKLTAVKQTKEEGTSHKRKDLYEYEKREIKLDKEYKASSLIRDLRAFTTNKSNEAMFFKVDGKRFSIQINIQEENE